MLLAFSQTLSVHAKQGMGDIFHSSVMVSLRTLEKPVVETQMKPVEETLVETFEENLMSMDFEQESTVMLMMLLSLCHAPVHQVNSYG